MLFTTIIISRSGDDDFSDELAKLCAALGGVQVLLIPHLYHLSEESPLWAELPLLSGNIVVVAALYPRPAAWLLRRHGVEVDERHIFNSNTFDSARSCFAAIHALLALPLDAQAAVPVRDLDEPVGPRWYPVLDKSRCVDCGHCLQFCLFGVYTPGEGGQVQVTYPDRCKPGCPACSRICPHGAIIFPLYAKNEAIAGAPGLLMTPDPAARKLYYLRTKQPCPLCGQTEKDAGSGPLCPECGRPVPAQTEKSAVFAEIDDLIDAVDEMINAKGG